MVIVHTCHCPDCGNPSERTLAPGHLAPLETEDFVSVGLIQYREPFGEEWFILPIRKVGCFVSHEAIAPYLPLFARS